MSPAHLIRMMSRARFIPLLALILIGANLYAQRGWNRGGGGVGMIGPGTGGVGMIGPGTGGVGASGPGTGGVRGVRPGEFRVNTHTRHPRDGRPIGGGFLFDPFWYGGYYNEPVVIEREVPVQPQPAPVVTPEPQRPPTEPKITEFPAARNGSPTRTPAAVFVLSSGERIESRHYLLTASSVQLTVERKRRSIPLEALDLRATLAANRERGLDLQIPTGGSEVVLGF